MISTYHGVTELVGAQVYSKFGPVIRLVSFVKNDKFQSLVQYQDPMAASTARMVWKIKLSI